jgi:two-component system cell cycle sensor histidine kinase/response regulator CckA
VNARDAMPKGGKLTIECKKVKLEQMIYQHTIAIQPPGEYVLLSISDTGIGIDKETQARIFEPFFTTKDRGKGTGLGLSTVYGIIKQSGGFIWVYSEPGQGTTFKIYFPLLSATSQRRTFVTETVDGLNGNETVLLVEDEKMVRELAERILTEFGYKVLVAENGEVAKQIFEQQKEKIQIVVTDIIMPGISGRDLAAHIKKENPDIKLLYISGYSDEAILHHNKIDNGSEFLQKPFTAQKFVRRVRQILDEND